MAHFCTALFGITSQVHHRDHIEYARGRMSLCLSSSHIQKNTKSLKRYSRQNVPVFLWPVLEAPVAEARAWVWIGPGRSPADSDVQWRSLGRTRAQLVMMAAARRPAAEDLWKVGRGAFGTLVSEGSRPGARWLGRWSRGPGMAARRGRLEHWGTDGLWAMGK